MITRVRFEASSEHKTEVHDDLLIAISESRAQFGSEWDYEENFQTTKDGWWGYATITRKDTNGSN